jgi:hydroxyacylglutathione hydrolase
MLRSWPQIDKDAPMITVTALPAFNDNYLWLLTHNGAAAVVDPGDSEVVLAALRARSLHLAAILITHHHGDHTGGIAALRAGYPNVPVYGPRAEADRISGLTETLIGGDRIEIAALGAAFEIIAVPGHTLGHIAYYNAPSAAPGDESKPLLFCGDTLFAGGCGRVFEGTAAQMYTSLAQLSALPAETRVYCAHEYTLSNLDFATAVEPENTALAAEVQRVKQLRADGVPSVPTTIGHERALNPFLRSGEPTVAAAVSAHEGQRQVDPVAVFAALRRWKDGYRPRNTL